MVQRTPASSKISRAAACSIVSPGSTKPARHDQKPGRHAAWRPSRHLSPCVASMIATGSTRGKCSAPQSWHFRFQPASSTVVRVPQLAQKPCRRCHSNSARAVAAAPPSNGENACAAARKSSNTPSPAIGERSRLNEAGNSSANTGEPFTVSPRNKRCALGLNIAACAPSHRIGRPGASRAPICMGPDGGAEPSTKGMPSRISRICALSDAIAPSSHALSRR